MKKSTSSLMGHFAYLVALLITTSVFFVACKDEKDPEPDAPKPPKISCVTISRAQLQAWVDSGWTKPGSSGQINEVVLQFAGSNGGTSLQLIGYPGNAPANVKDGGKITLAVDTSCRAAVLTGDVVFGNNILGLDKLGIFNKEGGLNEFDFIRLSPEQKYPPYINYKIQVVIKGQVQGDENDTRPCPIYCEPD